MNVWTDFEVEIIWSGTLTYYTNKILDELANKIHEYRKNQKEKPKKDIIINISNLFM